MGFLYGWVRSHQTYERFRFQVRVSFKMKPSSSHILNLPDILLMRPLPLMIEKSPH